MPNHESKVSMDIALVFVGISSMKEHFLPLVQVIESLIKQLLDEEYEIRVAMIESFPNNRSVQPIVHSFTKLSTVDQKWSKKLIGNLYSSTTHQNLAICDALRAALDLEWIVPNDSICHENLVFLITDSYPCEFLVDPHETGYHDGCCDCDDLWKISDRFVEQNLTLAIVGLGVFMEFCDGLYGAVAKNTGGEYIPIVNASRILWILSESLILNGYTLSQSFRHIQSEEFERNSSYHHSSIQEDRQQTKHNQTSARRAFWLMNK